MDRDYGGTRKITSVLNTEVRTSLRTLRTLRTPLDPSNETRGPNEGSIVTLVLVMYHMTKGQRALAQARIFPDSEKRGRGNKSSLNDDFSSTYLKQARIIIKYAPDLGLELLRLPGCIFLQIHYGLLPLNICLKRLCGLLGLHLSTHP